MKGIFVTGIDTDTGKSVVSSILVKLLQSDYWKPIQTGNLAQTDSLLVKRLVGKNTTIWPEAYAFKHPLSPHTAAEMEGETIQLSNITPPETNNFTIVEGAGGLLVPLNQESTILDLMCQLKLPVVLVAKNYLGSINHTLLSVKTIQNAGLKLKGIILVGDQNPSSEKAICAIGNTQILGHVSWSKKIDPQFISSEAEKLEHIKEQLLHD